METIQEFAQSQLQLIQAEKQADIEQMSVLHSNISAQELQKLGVCLCGLSVTGIRSGLGGKTLVDFEKDVGGSEGLPAHSFRSGDIVGIDEYQSKTRKDKKASPSQPPTTGIVYKVTDSCLTLSFTEDLPDHLTGKCNLSKMANNVTYERCVSNPTLLHYDANPKMNRMQKAMIKLENISENNQLVRVLLGLSTPIYDSSLTLDSLTFFDQTMNPSQQEAVRFALSASEVAIIHGPPGTGKTFTCVELIRQLVKRGDRVLVCGPSNLSVDNLVERLSKCKLDLVRIGHPARILPTVLDHALEVRLRTCHEGQIVQDVRQEMDQTFQSIQKAKKSADRKVLYQDMKQLRNELRNREKIVVESLIKNANVILSTLNGAASRVLQFEEFDAVLIDEASQALEAESWIAALKTKRLLLAGDHMQLPPTVKSTLKTKLKSGKSTSLETTLIDRLLKMYGGNVKRLLDTQYRMNELIMNFSSKEFYDGRLKAHHSVKNRLLRDIPAIKESEETQSALMLIDTTGNDFRESMDSSSNQLDDSKYNQGEAAQVVRYVRFLRNTGMPDEDVAIISPYNAQVNLLKSSLKEEFPGIEIGTVDGFQGREKEVIILTLVRNNDDHEIGFLKESRRLNVALTRAKSHLVVVCNGEFMTASKDGVLKRLIEYLEDNALIEYCTE